MANKVEIKHLSQVPPVLRDLEDRIAALEALVVQDPSEAVDTTPVKRSSPVKKASD